MPTDPVCGMFVPEDTDLTSVVDGQTYYFCSKTCQQKYSSPEKEAVRLKRRLALGWGLAIPIIIINYLVPASPMAHGQAMTTTETNARTAISRGKAKPVLLR